MFSKLFFELDSRTMDYTQETKNLANLLYLFPAMLAMDVASLAKQRCSHSPYPPTSGKTARANSNVLPKRDSFVD